MRDVKIKDEKVLNKDETCKFIIESERAQCENAASTDEYELNINPENKRLTKDTTNNQAIHFSQTEFPRKGSEFESASQNIEKTFRRKDESHDTNQLKYTKDPKAETLQTVGLPPVFIEHKCKLTKCKCGTHEEEILKKKENPVLTLNAVDSVEKLHKSKILWEPKEKTKRHTAISNPMKIVEKDDDAEVVYVDVATCTSLEDFGSQNDQVIDERKKNVEQLPGADTFTCDPLKNDAGPSGWVNPIRNFDRAILDAAKRMSEGNLHDHRHSLTSKASQQQTYKCTFCEKAFDRQSLLAVHSRKHTRERQFSCEFCPKKFHLAIALSKHRLFHTGERAGSSTDSEFVRSPKKETPSHHLKQLPKIEYYTCSFCEKKFKLVEELNAHMVYHTEQNVLKCNDCGKVFIHKKQLQLHEISAHVQQKPSICKHCNKTFTAEEDLVRHSTLHCKEKPQKCPTCNRQFTSKTALKVHLMTHTKKEMHACQECGQTFSSKKGLSQHMRSRHNEPDDEKGADTASAKTLSNNVSELLRLLIDEPTLSKFGWPNKAVDEILESVISCCGHTPVSRDNYSYEDHLRANAKLFFTAVIDDEAVKTLLNNLTVDEVIAHVLRVGKA